MTEADGAWLARLPKVELHLHLEGTVRPETLVQLSRRHDAEPLDLEQARALYTYQDFTGFLQAFKAVAMRLRTADDYALITREMIGALAAQNVVHAEVYISFGILARLRPDLPVEEVMAAVEEARLEAEAATGTSVLWLVDAVRQFGVNAAWEAFQAAARLRGQYPGIVGVGIGGDERLGPAPDFREVYAWAEEQGLHRVCHAGENTGPEFIWGAVNIGAERIGHALSARQDADLMDMLAERQLPLELNVISNLRTGCCRSIEEHPVREYFERGLLVTLNSDDPPMFGTSLNREFATVMDHFEFSREQMRELASNAVEASFLPSLRKLELLRNLENYPA